MIINTLEKTINDKINITKTQMRFLLLLSDNEIHSNDEILKYMGWLEPIYIYLLVKNIRKIEYLNKVLINIRGVGYKINEEVLLTKEKTKIMKHEDKEYMREYQRMYRLKNKERIKEYQRELYLKKRGYLIYKKRI